MKSLMMLAAAFVVTSLVAVTWALTRISAWVVFHDSVWGQMDKEGAKLEHGIAEAFLVTRDFYIPAVEAVVGLLFLVLLWRVLPVQSRRSELK
jgi:hypothetical protein